MYHSTSSQYEREQFQCRDYSNKLVAPKNQKVVMCSVHTVPTLLDLLILRGHSKVLRSCSSLCNSEALCFLIRGFEVCVEERKRGRKNMYENTDNEAKEKCVCLGRISPVSSRVADLVYEVC